MNNMRNRLLHPMHARAKDMLIAAGATAAVTAAFQLGEKTAITLPNKLQDFVTLSLSIFIEAFPFLILGSLLAAAIQAFVSPHLIHTILPKNRHLRRAVISLLGFMLPVCECGNVPLSRSLITQGLKPSDATTFLLAAPVLNPVTIWSTWAAFSYDENIIFARIFGTVAIANIIGFIISKHPKESELLTSDFQTYCKTQARAIKKSSGIRKKTTTFLRTFSHEAVTMLGMLALGALIAGGIQSFVPRDLLLAIGGNVVLSIVAMLFLAFVVSICANVDAFFALSFASTFGAGSIVSFLVFGPMIDIKMLALMRTTFTKHLLIIISFVSLLLSALLGLVVSYAF